MTLLAAVVLLIWNVPPTADMVMVYSSSTPACVRPAQTHDFPWCYRTPRGCRQGGVNVQAVETAEALSGVVSVEHEALLPGEVRYFLAVPVKGCWEFDVRLEVRHGE